MRLRLFQSLFYLLAPLWLFAQVTVSGTVNNDKGVPVQGASVRLKNSNVGTSTDANGKFSLTLPGSGGVLEISSVGQKTQNITVSSAMSDLVVKMEEDISHLDEVIVTGLASSVKRSNLAHAVGTISAKQLVGTTSQPTVDGAFTESSREPIFRPIPAHPVEEFLSDCAASLHWWVIRNRCLLWMAFTMITHRSRRD